VDAEAAVAATAVGLWLGGDGVVGVVALALCDNA
jgi:hypothetical protein